MNHTKFKHAIQQLVHLSPACWKALGSNLYTKTIQKEQFFSKEQSATKEIAFMQSGLMRIYYLDPQGNEWNKKFLMADDFVMASVNPSEQSKVFIQAIKETELVAISYADFLALAEKYPKLLELAHRLTAQYVSAKEAREISLLSMSAKERYQRFLEDYASIKDELPQYHIASYLGVTPTQLSRIRKGINI
ncbi:MAG: Crp/Fnr family transcriptional regulator [Bacteroidota bacterium]